MSVFYCVDCYEANGIPSEFDPSFDRGGYMSCDGCATTLGGYRFKVEA